MVHPAIMDINELASAPLCFLQVTVISLLEVHGLIKATCIRDTTKSRGECCCFTSEGHTCQHGGNGHAPTSLESNGLGKLGRWQYILQ